jgi:hypothetical protein
VSGGFAAAVAPYGAAPPLHIAICGLTHVLRMATI